LHSLITRTATPKNSIVQDVHQQLKFLGVGFLEGKSFLNCQGRRRKECDRLWHCAFTAIAIQHCIQ
jgi:hypothetical protein